MDLRSLTSQATNEPDFEVENVGDGLDSVVGDPGRGSAPGAWRQSRVHRPAPTTGTAALKLDLRKENCMSNMPRTLLKYSAGFSFVTKGQSDYFVYRTTEIAEMKKIL